MHTVGANEMNGRVLLVDDDLAFCEMVADALGSRSYQVTFFQRGADALDALDGDDFDVVVSDVNMAGMPGTTLCAHVVARRPDLPVILITGFGSLEAAVSAIRAGAYDFLSKPVDLDVLDVAIRRALERRGLQQEVRRLRRAVRTGSSFEDLIGSSPPMREVFDLIDRVASTDTSVLVTGESGTGKELVAQAIHKRSRRREGPFVPVNCAAIPEALLESQLFGHVRGAFTDAHRSQAGLFVQANGGTVFLDEIGDLPIAMQPKILRAIQERKVRPVGGDREIAFDARIVSATHRDLETAIEERVFREDLYFRLNVVQVDVPPLRARGGDVLLLAQRFLETHAARADKPVREIAVPAAEKLLAYPWPGNVRELQNCIERAVALTRFDQVGIDDLPPRVRDHVSTHVIVAGDDPTLLPPLDEVERRYILRVLEVCEGHRTAAARVLGLDRKTLYRKLRAYGLGPDDPAGS
jgi:two-component system response regulator HydG